MEGLQLRCSLAETTALTTSAPSGGVTAGQMGQINGVVGIYVSDAEEGAPVAFLIRAARALAPCTPPGGGMGMSVGDKVYFDLLTGKLTLTATDTLLCGIVAVDSESDAEWVEVVFDGMLNVTP